MLTRQDEETENNTAASKLPSKRTRGLSRNISLQDLKGTSLVQLRPHTLKQAERQISGSLRKIRSQKNQSRLHLTVTKDAAFSLLHLSRGNFTWHKCKSPDKPKKAAPGPACPSRLTPPNEICTSGFLVAKLQRERESTNRTSDLLMPSGVFTSQLQ